MWEAFYQNPDPDKSAVEEKIRAVRQYKSQATKYLGNVHVEQRLAMARNGGENVRSGEMGENWNERTRQQYSKDRLAKIGKIFRR